MKKRTLKKLTKLFSKKGVFKSWGGLALSLLAIASGVILVRNPQLLGVRAETIDGSYSLSGPTTAVVNQPFTVTMMADSDGAALAGLDAIIRFPQNQLRVTNVQLVSLSTSTLKSILPSVDGRFAAQSIITDANTIGQVRLSALAFDPTTQKPTAAFVARNTELFSVTFVPLTPGESILQIVTTGAKGVPTSSMAAVGTDGVANVLSRSTGLMISVMNQPSASPTPTATPRPTPTPTPTPVPTPTPRPTPTFTPRPSPTPVPSFTPRPSVTPLPTVPPTPLPSGTPEPQGQVRRETSRVSFSSADANQDGPDKLDPLYGLRGRRLWIGNGASATDSYAGLQFANVTVPSNAHIKSATIKVRSSHRSLINTSLQIRGITGAVQPFSSTNLLSEQPLTYSAAIQVNNVQLQQFSLYELGQLQAVIQELVNRPDWQGRGTMGFVIKGMGEPNKRNFVYSYDGFRYFAPQLVIEYYLP